MILKNGTKFKDYSNFLDNLKNASVNQHLLMQSNIKTHLLMDVLDVIYYAIKNLLSPIKTHMSK